MTTSAEVELVDPTRDETWDDLIASHPEHTIFHMSAWARVLLGTYGHRPFYFRLLVGQKTAALVPIMEVSSPLTGRRGVSLPFSDFCGALTFADCDHQLIVGELAHLARVRGWSYAEVRGGDWMAPSTLPPSFFGHTLDLRVGLERLRAGLAAAVRRNLRKAESSGVTVGISRKWEDLLSFYSLHMRTRRRHGVPPQSLAFFRNLYEHVIKGGLGFVVLATVASRSIAAAVFLRAREKAVYKFGASDERFQLHRANNLVMWSGIRYLMEDGADTLDFGRTEMSNDGLRRFKLAWGSKEQALVYARFSPTTMTWASAPAKRPGLYHRIFKTLPLAVNRVLGALCYPHLD